MNSSRLLRQQRDRKLDARSFAISTKGSLRSKQSTSQFVLEDDYTSAYSYSYSYSYSNGDPEHTLEPSSRSWRRRRRKRCCSSLLRIFVLFASASLFLLWAKTHLHMGQHIQQSQSQSSAVVHQMLADFVISAASADSFLYGDLEVAQNETADQPRLLQVSSLSLAQEGSPIAKFSPLGANQQMDRLLKGKLHSSNGNLMVQQNVNNAISFQSSPFAQPLSDNLKQCTTIVSNPNSVHELLYWEQHPEDFSHISQWFQVDSRYITFEPPATGGFASQRLVLEHMITLAYALGRTLVLPPRQGMRDGTLIALTDYFPTLLSHQYKGLRIIGMQEFLQYVALPGHLRANNIPVSPPDQRIQWDSAADIGLLYHYLRTVGTVPYEWDPQQCIVGYRPALMEKHLARIFRRMDGRVPPTPLEFQGKPVPANAPEMERLREFLAERTRVCRGDMYQSSVLLHVPTTFEGRSLLQVPFYSFFFFDSWQQDLIVKRMMRDVVRYNDVIVCAAARIIDWLQSHSPGGQSYDAIHIRGPSYEDSHRDVNTNPAWILHDVAKYIPKGSIVYIATDFGEPEWFEPLREQYQLYFASDFKGVFDTLLPWYLEMVEQLICARSRTFVGTYYSIFSAYTNRLRGYYSQRDGNDGGAADGTINSYYASPVAIKKDMKMYKAIRKPFTMREFPIAWRDINHGVSLSVKMEDTLKAQKPQQQQQQPQQQSQQGVSLARADQKQLVLPVKWV